jgi:hypothetical protein
VCFCFVACPQIGRHGSGSRGRVDALKRTIRGIEGELKGAQLALRRAQEIELPSVGELSEVSAACLGAPTACPLLGWSLPPPFTPSLSPPPAPSPLPLPLPLPLPCRAMFCALQDIMRIDSEIQEIKDDIEQSSAEVEEATHAVAQFDTLIPPVEAEVAELQQQLSNVRLLAHCLVVDVATGCRALGTARWASWVCVA